MSPEVTIVPGELKITICELITDTSSLEVSACDKGTYEVIFHFKVFNDHFQCGPCMFPDRKVFPEMSSNLDFGIMPDFYLCIRMMKLKRLIF